MRELRLSPIAVPAEPIPGRGRLWRTLADVTCEWRERGGLRRQVIPAGFETDGPSFPWWLRSLLTNVEWAASVVHDWDYENRPAGGWLVQIAAKARADLKFSLGLAYTRRHWGLRPAERLRYRLKHNLLVVPGVVLGGWVAWLT